MQSDMNSVHFTPKYHHQRTGAANLPQKGAGLAKGRSILCANDHSVQGSAGAAPARVEEALLASVTLGSRIKVPPPALPCPPLPKDKYPRQVSTSSACSQDLQLQNFVGGQQLVQAVQGCRYATNGQDFLTCNEVNKQLFKMFWNGLEL